MAVCELPGTVRTSKGLPNNDKKHVRQVKS